MKSISSALEASQAESSAWKLDRERLEEDLLECQNKFADKSKLCDQYFTAMEENEKKLNESSLLLDNLTA